MPSADSVRRALDGCIRHLEAGADGAFSGTARFGAALAGPPQRLHGGLHAYTRIVSVWNALTGAPGQPIPAAPSTRPAAPTGPAAPFPLHLSMRVERPLLLDEDVSFSGSYVSADQSWTLHTRFAGTERLDAHARSALPLAPDARIPWQEVFAQVEREPGRVIRVRNSFPVQVHSSACFFDLDDAFRGLPENELRSALRPDGTADAVFACVALDWMGAIGMGVRWQARLYTTRLDLQLDTDQLPADKTLRAAVDCTRPLLCQSSELRPVSLRGEEVRATSLPVALLSADLTQIYAEGRVTLIPIAGQTERLVAPAPE